jgi:tetratricopeptide (TPR) repeat protein
MQRLVIAFTFLAVLALSSLRAQPQPSSWLGQVKGLIAGKQLDSAEKLIVAQMMDRPRDPALMTLLAEVRLDQGHLAEALTLLTNADKLGGATAMRAALIGLVQIAAGRLDLAEPEFRRAIRLDPKYAGAHYFLARLLYTQNRFDEAIEESKIAINLSPGFVRAYENVGLCYEGKQDFQEAEHWYQQAIQRERANRARTEWPWLDLATMLIKRNQLAKAKPYLSQALAINPRNAQAVLEMGILLEESGDAQGALGEFRTAIRLKPRMASAYYRAARISQKLGDTVEAERDFAIFRQISAERH